MEAEREVKTIQVHLKCPDCEINMGLEGPGNSSWLSNIKTYIYKCSRCGTSKETENVYPYLKYVSK